MALAKENYLYGVAEGTSVVCTLAAEPAVSSPLLHPIRDEQAATRRTATARSRVRLPPEVTTKIQEVGGEVVGKKGPVFTTAIVAGVQAAKRTSDLIPFCHPLPIEDCRVELSLKEGGEVVEVDCTVRVTHKTGVEMEAMMGASVAALTVYDMLKGLSHDIVVEETALLSKTGGKRDFSRTGHSAQDGSGGLGRDSSRGGQP